MYRLVLNVVFVSAVYLVSFSEQEDNTDQAASRIVADSIDATAGLNFKGAVYIDGLGATSHNPDDILPARLIYTSVDKELMGFAYAETSTTSQVGDDLISDFLRNIPDLTPICQRQRVNKLDESASPVATFALHFVRRSDGYMSDLSDPTQGNQPRLVFHEQELRTSGLASVSFDTRYDDTNNEHFFLYIPVFQQFCKLASELDCQNIWVTVKMGSNQKIGLCWKDGYKIIVPVSP